MSYSDSVIQAESGGDPNSQDPNSSASGPAGFINSTWLDTMRRHAPEIAQGRSDADLLALKTDPTLAARMADAYASDNAAILQKSGLPVTDGTKYLAHFAGPGGAVKILQADPNAQAGDILGAAALKANPFLKGMTAQGLQAWAAKKGGATLPPGMQGAQSAPQAAAQAPPPPAAPQQQMAPQFAQAPSAAPPVHAQFDPSLQPAQFQFARPQVDLTALRAQLAAQPPIFARG
jgi:hypothetical protein